MDSMYNKIGKKYYNVSKKIIKKLPLRDYMLINYYNYGPVLANIYTKNMGIQVTTKIQLKSMERNLIVKTLKESNFKREDNKWTPITITGFMTEVMDLYCEEHPLEHRVHSTKVFEKLKKEISERYNVPENKLKSELAFIITRFFNKMDTYNLLYYFTYEELLLWKYRDINKFQEDVEKNKIKEEDIELYKTIMNL